MNPSTSAAEEKKVDALQNDGYGPLAKELILAQPLNMLEKAEFVILHKSYDNKTDE